MQTNLGARMASTQEERDELLERAKTWDFLAEHPPGASSRKLGLKNNDEWREYRSSDRKPADIPAAPDDIYAEAGWAGYGDWLGTGNVAFSLRQYQPFNRARAFARSLGLKSFIEWRDYCKSGKKPIDIPSKPERYDEWAGYGDWLGTEFQFQPFKKARTFVRRLGLKSYADWIKYCASGKKPRDIPAGPQFIYADAGWAGMGDWLGTGTIATRLRQYRSFKEARTFARSLGLKSSTAWFDYCRSGAKPTDIPYSPRATYAEAGWAGYGDWLGTGRAAPGTFRSFKLARDYVHRLSLKSKPQWNEYCASGKKPADIPAAPQAVYAEAGWAGYGDWLGTGRVATHLRQYKSFKEARAYVHGLGLKSETQWRAYCKAGKKPADIPAKPDRTYANDGWAGWADWLGNGRVVRRSMSIKPGEQGVAEGVAS